MVRGTGVSCHRSAAALPVAHQYYSVTLAPHNPAGAYAAYKTDRIVDTYISRREITDRRPAPQDQ